MFNFLKNGVLVALFYSKVYFLYLRLIFSRDRGYFEITFLLNAHKIALLRNSPITSFFVFNLILKNAFEHFYFLRKMADCSQSFFI